MRKAELLQRSEEEPRRGVARVSGFSRITADNTSLHSLVSWSESKFRYWAGPARAAMQIMSLRSGLPCCAAGSAIAYTRSAKIPAGTLEDILPLIDLKGTLLWTCVTHSAQTARFCVEDSAGGSFTSAFDLMLICSANPGYRPNLVSDISLSQKASEITLRPRRTLCCSRFHFPITSPHESERDIIATAFQQSASR